jgi:uncharacterized protein YcbX
MLVSSLHVYPVKSCRGITLEAVDVGPLGLRYDRQWMVVDERGMFVAQRADGRRGVGVRTLCLVRTAIADGRLCLTAPGMPPLDLPLEGLDGPERAVEIWDAPTSGLDQGDAAAAWFTAFLSRERPGQYRVVRMPDDGGRAPSTGTGALAYADGYPFLVISEASLDDLNARLDVPLPMNRFRPNIVLSGVAPYEEDHLARIRIGGVEFVGMTRCPRCPIPTTDQDTAERGVEPLRTLATYRRTAAGVVFGRNFNHQRRHGAAPSAMTRIVTGAPVEVLARD